MNQTVDEWKAEASGLAYMILTIQARYNWMRERGDGGCELVDAAVGDAARYVNSDRFRQRVTSTIEGRTCET